MASATPRTSTVAGVTVTPVLIKVSEGAAAGGTLTIQGRYLGSAQTARILTRAVHGFKESANSLEDLRAMIDGLPTLTLAACT